MTPEPHSVPADAQAVIVGAGPAGLIAAERLAAAGVRPFVLDAMPTPARKFLMAGRGGLNLTHSEPPADFPSRYGARAEEFRPLLAAFGPDELRAWADGLDADTFVGSSGRVFPRALKASPLLRAWLRRLADMGVVLHTRHRLTGIDADGALHVDTPGGSMRLRPRVALLALGGATWPRLGSDATWVPMLHRLGIDVAPLRPANCGFTTAWSEPFARRAEGIPLKNLELRFEGLSARGDVVITRSGLEGGAIYALSSALRDAIERQGAATLRIDLRPQLTEAELVRRLERPRGADSTANWLRKTLGGGAPLAALLRELVPETLGDPRRIAAAIKSLPVRLIAAAPIDRAISTAGGIPFEALDEHLMLRRLPGLFVAGEMLDWEAPTGGYLLQGCFATGIRAAHGMIRHLRGGG
jgi:uncharacterized flavoprotein (TIGR03862 family)